MIYFRNGLNEQIIEKANVDEIMGTEGNACRLITINTEGKDHNYALVCVYVSVDTLTINSIMKIIDRDTSTNPESSD